MKKVYSRHKSGNYIRLKVPDHPQATARGYVLEHNYLMEKFLRDFESNHPALLEGGGLCRTWVVHHINGNGQDNRLENLELMKRKNHHPGLHYSRELDLLRFEVMRLKTILEINEIRY